MPAADEAPGWRLVHLLYGTRVTDVIGGFARLGIADLIVDGARAATDIAAELGADAAATDRLLRAATALDLLKRSADGRYSLTEMGHCLRSGPASLRDFAMLQAAPAIRRPFEQLAEAVRSGRSVASPELGGQLWEYYREHPDEAKLFDDGMTSLSSLIATEVAGVLTISDGERVVDVGGGHGYLLTMLLAGVPGGRGVLFDQSDVIDGADVPGNIEAIGGDFLDAVPAGGTTYLLSHILHDWNDTAARRILRNCHAAAEPGARLVIIDRLLPDPPDFAPPFLLDLNLLVLADGAERTLEQFNGLLEETGWELIGSTSTGGAHAVLEAQRAE